jgi:hypothetical protein
MPLPNRALSFEDPCILYTSVKESHSMAGIDHPKSSISISVELDLRYITSCKFDQQRVKDIA